MLLVVDALGVAVDFRSFHLAEHHHAIVDGEDHARGREGGINLVPDLGLGEVVGLELARVPGGGEFVLHGLSP